MGKYPIIFGTGGKAKNILGNYLLPSDQGNNNDVMTSDGAGGVTWAAGSALSGLGSTDNALLRADGTGGSTAQGSGTVLDDSDNMTFAGLLILENLTTAGLPAAGNAGALAFNTTEGELWRDDGVSWSIVGSGIAGVVDDTTPQLGGMLDVNGQAIGDGTLELISFVETASAVNEITVTNAATGGNPTITATGDDANIGLTLTGKGTGGLRVPATSATGPGVILDNDTDSGIGSTGANKVNLYAAGTSYIQVSNSSISLGIVTKLSVNGSAAAPAFSWAADTDTGPYRIAANRYGLATGGVLRMEVNTTEIVCASIPVAPSYTDAGRPAASGITAGGMIWNTDDGAPNWSDGTNWVDAIGITT